MEIVKKHKCFYTCSKLINNKLIVGVGIDLQDCKESLKRGVLNNVKSNKTKPAPIARLRN